MDELLAVLDAHPVGHLPPVLRAERDLAVARMAQATAGPDISGAFGEAIASLRKAASPYHLAHGLLDYAAYLETTGESALAAPLVEEARGIGVTLGCIPLLDRAALVGTAAVGALDVGTR